MQEPNRANWAFCDVEDGAVVVVLDEPTLATTRPDGPPHAVNSTATAVRTNPAADALQGLGLGLAIEIMETFYARVFNTALTASPSTCQRRVNCSAPN
jgi:hypothetical protein